MKVISNPTNYDQFLKARFISGNFLQSSFWQDFLKSQGRKYWQLAVVDDAGETLALCLFHEKKLPLGRSYLFSAKGPIISNNLNDKERRGVLSLLLSKIRDITIATEKRAEIFYTLELAEENLLLPELIKTDDVNPRDTWVLDLKNDLKEMLGLMHAKTRYNIALATKKGVKIRFSKEEKDLDHFLRLISKTARRNQIVVHSQKHYRQLFSALIKNKAGELALAEVDGQVVAANIIVRFGEAVTYLHGASDYNFRKYMAPHLLQWETIKQSKELGYKLYDFWGVAPEDGSKPNWAGFTRFKKSFGGRLIKSPGTHSLIYSQSWYNLYKLSHKIRRILKR